MIFPPRLRRYCLTYPNSTLRFFWTKKRAWAWAEANPDHFLYRANIFGWKLIRDGFINR
jgi:hypothetical protein